MSSSGRELSVSHRRHDYSQFIQLIHTHLAIYKILFSHELVFFLHFFFGTHGSVWTEGGSKEMHAAQGCASSFRQVLPIVIVRLHAAPCVVQTKPCTIRSDCYLLNVRIAKCADALDDRND